MNYGHVYFYLRGSYFANTSICKDKTNVKDAIACLARVRKKATLTKRPDKVS